jgi:hypothetical protein
VLDADLSKYFDTIPYRQLVRAAARRISDGSVLGLLKQWLRAPVVEEDKEGRRRIRFDEGRSGNAEPTTSVGSIRLFPLRLLY